VKRRRSHEPKIDHQLTKCGLLPALNDLKHAATVLNNRGDCVVDL
jgi:hypothetical protein